MKNIKYLFISLIVSIFVLSTTNCYAFWLWSPKGNSFINPKFAVKDSPQEQFDWAMRFFKSNDFPKAAEEFERLTKYYPDSELAPEAQYYAGRSYEESGKYYFAFQNYQKTVEKYPYTGRLEEIIEREYNIANIFQTEDTPKLMELELSISLDRAIEVYKKIVENSPFGPFSDKALYKMAECYRRMRKYTEAVDSYQKLINDYPESSLSPEAKYQMAYTKYEASLDPEYDQESTEDALKEFKQISKNTPVPAIAEEADKVLIELRERKAASTLKVAEFYEKQKKYRSAIIYYNEIASKFKGTSTAEYAEKRIEYLKSRIKDK
ncbi:MAG: outer membrane protein assembly factor BamD [Candidatus Omnitrophota bacterium]